jgi:arylsulfatase A-like enzyme
VVLDEGYDADVQTDLAIEFIKRYRDEPFCLFVSWGPPHAPYRAVPQCYLDMYPPDEIALRPNAQGADRAAIAGYYAHITAIDRDVGRLMAALDRLGLTEDTIVVFSSDHGDMLWSQGRVKKQQPYEESIRIPLIVRWPGKVPAGEVSDLPMGVVDHAPTLLGLAGMPVPDEMNGLDLSNVLRGRSGERPRSAFIAEYVSFGQSSLYQPWRGVRTPRHTYARWLQGGAILYDNQQDPYQLHNLILDPSYASVRQELEAELQGWLARLDDPFLDPDACFRHIDRWQEWAYRKAQFPSRARR